MGILGDMARRDIGGRDTVENEHERMLYGSDMSRVSEVLNGTYGDTEYSIDGYMGEYPGVHITRCPEIRKCIVNNMTDSMGVMRHVDTRHNEFVIAYNVLGVDYMDRGEWHIEGTRHSVKKLVGDAEGYIDQIIDKKRRCPVF